MRSAVIIYGRENVIFVGKCMFQQILQKAAEVREYAQFMETAILIYDMPNPFPDFFFLCSFFLGKILVRHVASAEIIGATIRPLAGYGLPPPPTGIL